MEAGALYLEKMKALVLKEIGWLVCDDIPDPVPGDGQVLVRVTRCALCKTDAKMYFLGHRDLTLPRVLGHEICGVREDTKERVVVWPGESCGTCRFCRSGTENLCDSVRILGFNTNGGLAQKIIINESSLVMIPETLSDDAACLAEPLACAINAIEQLSPTQGESLLVFGAGSVGLLLALAAKAFGLIPSLVEINPEKLVKSPTFRNRMGLSASSSVDRDCFDMAINACPSMDAVSQGVRKIRKGGRFCLFSGLSQKETLPATLLNEIHYRQLRLVGAYGCALSNVKTAIRILDEFQEIALLIIEKKIGMEEVNEVMEEVYVGQTLKILTEIY